MRILNLHSYSSKTLLILVFQAQAEVVEVLGVIKLGVSLVQYIYNVFSDICKGDCSFSIDTRVRRIRDSYLSVNKTKRAR
jgi:hypothetical protein